MKKQIKRDVSFNEKNIKEVRAALIIPFSITILCFLFDLLFHLRIRNDEFETNYQRIYWVIEVFVSYFFPAFFSSAIFMIWQNCFTNSWKSIKEEKVLELLFISVIYFVLYITFLLFINTFYEYIFFIINFVYVYLFKKCLDQRIFTTKKEKQQYNEPS